MLNVIDLRGHRPSTSELRRALPRGGTDIQSVLPVVQPLVDDVRLRGAQAALEYGEKFDRVRPDSVKVPAEVIAAALENLEPQVREALEESISRVRKVHSEQVPVGHTTELSAGGTVTEKFMAVDRVGLYVPGGNAVYPSSVIMNVVPAQEAGASTMVVASPPQEQFGGWPHPTILAACSLLGVDEVWAVGGGQAIALLAYGDDAAQLEPVDMITGPGNIFVATAKHLVSGTVGIDAEAGPTEIAILADKTAKPGWVAADLIGQAEHDELAGSVLITDSTELADKVCEELAYRVPRTKSHERVETSLGGSQSAIVLTDGIEQSIAVANAYASEHLEIQTANTDEVLDQIRNAGAIFRGGYSPVPLGDYMSGSNHVLPTGGTARFAAGLGVHTFLKPVEVIEYDETGLKAIAAKINTFAVTEDLPAHGESVLSRFVEDPYDKATLDQQETEAGLQ